MSYQRILSEWKEINHDGLSLNHPFRLNDTTECGVRLSPLRQNLLEWHFTFTGIEGSAFEGGLYHGRIRLHPEYPQKAPSISIMTPSGRWVPGMDICLSASAYHQESWQPSWTLRTLVLSLRGFMTTQAREIGGITSTRDVHRTLARMSRSYVCTTCGVRHSSLLGLDVDEAWNRPILAHSKGFLANGDESLIYKFNPSFLSKKKNKNKKESSKKSVARSQKVVVNIGDPSWRRHALKQVYTGLLFFACFFVLGSVMQQFLSGGRVALSMSS
eukprot:gene4585-5025_t